LRRFILIFGVLASCGGVASTTPPDGGDAAAPVFPAADYGSGSRLRAQTYRTADGDAIFHGWFDTKLNIACTFQLADDGVLRCLPSLNGYEVVYSDASCTTASVMLDHYGVDPPGPRYATLQSCAGARAFLGSDAPLTSTQTIFAPFPGDYTCKPATDDFTTFSITPVDASAFVSAQTIIKPIDDTVGARVIVAEDGAFETPSAYDIVHTSACDLDDPNGNATSICAPSQLAFPSSTCGATPVADACSNALPTALRVQNGCVASAWTAAPSTQSCYAGGLVTLTTGQSFDAPHITQTIHGTSRLQKRWVTTTSGTPIRVAGFYDSLLETSCSVAVRADVAYCIPDYQDVVEPALTRFIDGCQEPAIVANACSMPKFAMTESPLQFFIKGAPLEIGTKLCFQGEGCGCGTYDGSFAAYHSIPLSFDALAQLQDVTE
jgi:hypothetical protein